MFVFPAVVQRSELGLRKRSAEKTAGLKILYVPDTSVYLINGDVKFSAINLQFFASQ